MLNEFLQNFDLNLDNFEETENGISFLNVFNNNEEIDSYLSYDYTEIFNKFKNSFKILISNPSDSTEMQIIKYGYNKQNIK